MKPVGIVNLAPVKTSKVFYLSLDLIKMKKKGHFGHMYSGISSTFNVTKNFLHPTIE